MMSYALSLLLGNYHLPHCPGPTSKSLFQLFSLSHCPQHPQGPPTLLSEYLFFLLLLSLIPQDQFRFLPSFALVYLNFLSPLASLSLGS